MNTSNKNVAGAAVIALVIGLGVGYSAGHSLAGKNGRPGAGYGTLSGMNRGGTFMGRGGAGMMGGFLSGTVAKQDSGSITLNTRDGSSRLVLMTPATTVSKSVTGTLSDVSVGSEVIVSGTTNSDGSISATLIQLRPATTAQSSQ